MVAPTRGTVPALSTPRLLGEQLAARLSPDVRMRLAEDPFTAVAEHFGLKVSVMKPGAGNRVCSCDGAFNAETKRIVVAETPFSRRSFFTCVHELGHALLWEDAEFLSHLEEMDRPNAGRVAEEHACDSFAAAILVPVTLVDDVLSDGTLRAQHFLELFHRSQASREACAVRLAQRLQCDGHVMLASAEGLALFTASVGPYTVARGVPQGNDHISVAAGSRGQARGESFVRYRSERTQPMFGDAVSDGRFVYVVLAEAPQWPVEGATVHRFAKDRADLLAGECSNCGHVFETFDTPCQKCGALRCPECGLCECPSRVRERTCKKCFLVKPAHLFPEGSDRCRDCS